MAISTQETFCTFQIEDLYCGIEVRKVQEVIRYQDLTRVPLAGSVLRGLMNLRGQIVTVLDLRQRFGLPDFPDEEFKPMNVVVRTKEGPISLLVDRIGDVVEVDQEGFEVPPDTLQSQQRELIRGAFKLDKN